MAGRISGVLPFLLFLAVPLAGQQPDSERIRALEQRVEQLAKEAEELRSEIAALRGQSAPAADDAQDLTNVAVVPAAPVAAAQPKQDVPAALTDVKTVDNVVSPAASKVFNPDIAVIGDFLGKAGAKNPHEFGAGSERSPLAFDDAEIGLQAFVDPYAKASFFLGVSNEGISIEEGYAKFVALPYDLGVRAGKFKAAFGKANTWHTHSRSWVDQPLVIHNFFGDEQLADEGVEVSKLFPNRFAYLEATGEVFAGNVYGVFERRTQGDLFYNAHLKAFKDITENSNVEIGASWARGGAAYANTSNQFAGIDVTWRWKPLQQGNYRGIVGRFEGMLNRSPWHFARNPRGFYASVDYQLAQRWFAGVRVDRADEAAPAISAGTMPGPIAPLRDRGASAILTFWPSEFSQVRAQLRRTAYGNLEAINEILFQLQFSIGAHGAHSF